MPSFYAMKAGSLRLVLAPTLVVFRDNTILATPTSQLSPVVNVNDMEAGRNGDGQTVSSYS